VSPQHITLGTGSTFGADQPVLSDAVGFADLVLLSGRAPVDPATLELVSSRFDEQAQFVLRNVGEVLAAAGSSWELVLRVECFLASASDFPAWNRIWCERFKPPRPARTTVLTGFTVPGMLIELQVTAARAGTGQ